MTVRGADVAGDTVSLLWPSSPGRRSYRVLSSDGSPRFLVPEEPRRAATAGLRAVRDARSARARALTSVVCAAFRAAPASLLPGRRIQVGDGGIDERLSEELGRALVATAHLGPPRANRKPVLALTSPDGEVVGFAKVGMDPLTSSLVGNELHALSSLARLSCETFVTPHVLSSGQWQGQPYVVQSPLPLGRSRGVATPGVVSRAQVELARSLGPAPVSPGAGDYLPALLRRLEAEGGTGRALADALAQDPDVAAVPVEAGTWHGDWRTSNFAVQDGTVLVWDWERFDTGVPVGYDALHLWLTTRAPGHADLSTLADALRGAAPTLLAPFGLDPSQAQVTATLYLAELGARYLADRQHETRARLGDVSSWILPHLQQRAGVSGA